MAKAGRRVTSWTQADEAELDVLVHALAFDYWEHRKHCEACRAASVRGVHIRHHCDDIRPDPCDELEAWFVHRDGCAACQQRAPLTFGPPCPDWRDRRLEHGRTCRRCTPCPHLQAAIHEVVDWREARILLSQAEALRIEQRERAA
jgi:hypothetical protein